MNRILVFVFLALLSSGSFAAAAPKAMTPESLKNLSSDQLHSKAKMLDEWIAKAIKAKNKKEILEVSRLQSVVTQEQSRRAQLVMDNFVQIGVCPKSEQCGAFAYEGMSKHYWEQTNHATLTRGSAKAKEFHREYLAEYHQ